MKENILEYHRNKRIKHIVVFHDNDRKEHEYFYNEKEILHRINKPAIQSWYGSGCKSYESYYKNGKWHNISNPSRIEYTYDGKINWKSYYINGDGNNKLNWMNLIKNI
jgi:hypothetical protein